MEMSVDQTGYPGWYFPGLPDFCVDRRLTLKCKVAGHFAIFLDKLEIVKA